MTIATTVRKIRSIISEALLIEADGSTTDEASAKAILKKFPKGMRALGINNIDSLKVLGIGTRGTAFDMGGGKVLKITNDEKEAGAAAVLLGKKINNIVNFFAVKRLKDTPYYVIVQEKLQPLSSEHSKAFNDALVSTGLPIWIKRAEGSWDRAKFLTKDYIIGTVKKKFSGKLDSPEAKEFASKINSQWNTLVNTYGLKEMFKTLTEFGIDFHDYHAGNMMQRDDGTLVLIDLGMSKIRASGGNVEMITQQMGLKIYSREHLRNPPATSADIYTGFCNPAASA
jgi:hypothetical protein